MTTITTWTYIKELFAADDRVAICMKNSKDNGPWTQRIVSAETACTSRFQSWLRAMNAQGQDIYIAVNPLRPGAKGREKSDILAVRRVFIDIDHDGDAAVQRILTDANLPKPNYVLNSSPHKYQVIWNVAGFSQSSAEQLIRQINQLFGGDLVVFDVARVLRLPGLHNKKYDNTFRITAAKHSSATYSPADFHRLPQSSGFDPPVRSRRKRVPVADRDYIPGVNSPSEHDWSYSCFKLEKSTNIEQTAHELEIELAARRQDKPRPAYYAKLTVQNARDHVERQRKAPHEPK